MNTITKSEFAEAARNTDALTEESPAQRLIFDGQDPTKLSRTETTQIQLSPRAQEVMATLQAVALDGVAIGITVKQER